MPRHSNTETCTHLLELIDYQASVITKQKEIIKRLTNENLEQENIINILMKDAE